MVYIAAHAYPLPPSSCRSQGTLLLQDMWPGSGGWPGAPLGVSECLSSCITRYRWLTYGNRVMLENGVLHESAVAVLRPSHTLNVRFRDTCPPPPKFRPQSSRMSNVCTNFLRRSYAVKPPVNGKSS